MQQLTNAINSGDVTSVSVPGLTEAPGASIINILTGGTFLNPNGTGQVNYIVTIPTGANVPAGLELQIQDPNNFSSVSPD